MWVWACILGFVVLFWQHKHSNTQDVVGGVTLSQPAGGKDLPKNDPTTIKTQLHAKSQLKQPKGHPKSIKFRRSKRLPH